MTPYETTCLALEGEGAGQSLPPSESLVRETALSEEDRKRKHRQAVNRAWIERNRERRRLQLQRWYNANKEKKHRQFRAWSLRNADRRRSYKKKWNHDHPELVKQYARGTFQRHGHKYRLKQQEYNAARKPKKLAYNRAYYAKHSERLRKQVMEYARSHPEIYHAIRVRRRIRTQCDCQTIRPLVKKWRSLKSFTCHWCGKKFPVKKLHIDHVIALAIGGTDSADNVCKSCSDCNMRKQDKPVSKFESAGQLFLL